MKFLSLKSDEFDRCCAILGIVISIILVAYTIIRIHNIIYLFPGFLSLMICVFWLLIRRKSSLNIIQTQSLSLCLLFLSIFFIFFTLSVLSFYFRLNLYERPFVYFIMTSLMVGIVCLELFLKSIKNFVLLVQILLIGISIAWSQMLLFPGLVSLDPWYYQMFTTAIIDSHNIPDYYAYSHLPLFNLFIASTSLITGLNYKFATMLSVSFVQIFCTILLVFLFCLSLFDNHKISLLASLSITICNYPIFMSYSPIPNAFSTLFVLYLLYLLLKLKSNSCLISTILSIIFMVALILTHTISSLFLAIILFTYWFGFKYYNLFYSMKESQISPKTPISFTYSIVFTVSMLAWWLYVSGHLSFMIEMLKSGYSANVFYGPHQQFLSISTGIVSLSEQLFNNCGMFFFFSFSFIGCFYMISKKYGNRNTFNFTIIGLIPLLIGFISLAFQRYILEDRWFYFAQVFLSIPFAVSIILITNTLKNNILRSMLLFILMTFISFLLIMSPPANVDNHIFSPNTTMTSSLTMSELNAAKTIDSIWNGTIKTDEYYSGSQQFTYRFEDFTDAMNQKNMLDLQTDLVLIRKAILFKPLKLYSSILQLDYDPRSLLSDSHFSKIYDCGSVEGYLYI